MWVPFFNFMKMKKIFCLIFALSFISVQAQNWQMVWSDEFDGNALNLDNWIYDLGTGSQFGLNGWGNNELQYYTDDESNVSVANGMLRIRAEQENVGGMNYTSGRIRTHTNEFWTYGKIEARIKLPAGQGLWPAFWMLPEAGFWPGEIDIMEIIGSEPNVLHGTTHQGTVGDVYSYGGSYYSPEPLTNDFHTYAIEWLPDNIIWYLDGVEYFAMNRSEMPADLEWLLDEDYYVLLNLAVGGNWPGAPDGTTSFPADMLVDYVRVYEYEENPTSNVTFRVNVTEQNLQAGDAVYLAGTFNNWCSTCQPMTDEGDGIWSVSLDLPVGIQEYKFMINGWDGLAEGWVVDNNCTMVTIDGQDVYINRFVNVLFEDISMPPFCFNECEQCIPIGLANCTDSDASNYNSEAVFDDGSCVYELLLSVDMGQEALGFNDDVHVNGTFNDWCGDCYQLIDVDNDGVYFISLDLPPGNYEYKFTTNGWEGLIESFDVGMSCTNTTFGGGGEVWTNRAITLGTAPLAPSEVCFNACESCIYPTVDMEFTVDVFNEAEAGIVTLNYEVDGIASALPMTHLGWGIWSAEITVPGSSEVVYNYEVNGAAETASNECMASGIRTIISDDMALPMVCFNECNLCNGCADPTFIEYNPFASAIETDCLTATLPGCTYSEASNFEAAANIDDGSCMFDLSSDCPEDLNGNGNIDTPDLLAFLGAFDSVCP